jgi:hypothetical protein
LVAAPTLPSPGVPREGKREIVVRRFSDEEAQKQLGKLLEAKAQGEVRIMRADGQEFIVRPAGRSGLDVGSVQVNPPITTEEIVKSVREGRERA